MSLRDQVDLLLPNWERWYPSLFDAANDLGLIRAEVCDPNSLLLTRRHAKVRQRAEDATDIETRLISSRYAKGNFRLASQHDLP